jgi:hypothetical protein
MYSPISMFHYSHLNSVDTRLHCRIFRIYAVRNVTDIQLSAVKKAVKFPHVGGYHLCTVFSKRETLQNPVAV